MTSPAVREYARAVRARYQAGGRQEKKRILDEFCETTRMHRKAVIRLLNRRPGPRAGWSGRPRRYGAEVMEALVKVWEVGDRMCGKLLAAVMADLVEALERHGELVLMPEVRERLLEISPASIDRLLSRHRRRLGVQPQRRSQPASHSLKGNIPIRTWSEWKDVPVGSLQADLVLHCGESTEGFFLASLCAVDMASGWTELNFFRPIRKLAAKERLGPRLIKRYDEPQTAYQRLPASGVLADEVRADLESLLHRLNPADLQRRIDALLRKLWRLGQNEHRLAEHVG